MVAGTPREVFSDPNDPYGWKKAEIHLVYALKLPGGYPAVRQRGGVSVMSPVEFLGLWYKTVSDS